MRDYSIVSPRFWIGETGRRIREAGAAAQVVALYLLTCPNSNMIGLYYLPLPTLAHETGVTIEGAKKALARLSEVGFAWYDFDSEVVWIPNMAAFQVGDRLDPRDKRVKGVQREAEKYTKSKFYADFCTLYGSRFHLTIERLQDPGEDLVRASEGDAGSFIQEQDQGHKQDQDHDHEQESAEPRSDSSPVAIRLPLNDKTEAAIHQTQVNEWATLFPAVDVPQELRKMRAWLDANPTRRKTRTGILRFCVKWLSRQQDEARGPTTKPGKRSFSEVDYRAGINEDGSLNL